MKEFQFRQFSVIHERSAMKVGTDGVLLGAWCGDLTNPLQIADIGTGCGLIALMMAQRFPLAQVEAIEIDTAATEEARENAKRSPWAHRIKIENIDFNDWHPDCRFDILVSNPPFFSESLHSPDNRRAQARHASSLSPLSLIRRAAELLTPTGVLSMITPTGCASEIEWEATLHHLHLNRRTDILTSPNQLPKRILWEFGITERSAIFDSLTVRCADGNSFTKEYSSLTAQFYL